MKVKLCHQLLEEIGKHYPSLPDSDILKSLIQNSFDLMKVAPRGSEQKQVICAVLVKSVSKTVSWGTIGCVLTKDETII